MNEDEEPGYYPPDEIIDDPEPEHCPACDSDRTESLGVLGNLEHFHCRQCGAQFSKRYKMR